jgi:hypothetical protein
LDLPAIQGHVEVVRSIAATLDPDQGDCASRGTRFTVLREQLQASTDSVHQQMAKVLASFQPGLFAGGDAADLPQDNLDLERWFRNPKGHERRIHGHRHAGVRIVLEGPTLIHALDVHQRHPESVHQHRGAYGVDAVAARCYRRLRAARRRRAALSCLRSALSRRSSTR